MPGARSAKKSTTPTKGAAKSKGHRYDYSELAKASLVSEDTHHVYGVIVDATFPYKSNKDKYCCSLKVIDPSLHSGKESHATVVIYARRFEDLPIVHRLGDVIRLHRATLRLYKNHRQFNVSTQWNGSWALFNSEKAENAPFAFSGKKPSFEKHETDILGKLRKWASSWFSSHDGVNKDQYTALKAAKNQSGDFDVVAKIMSIHEMDEYTNELRLRDGSGDAWNTLALKLKFPHLRAGQTVRIRSATYDQTSTHKNVLALSHYSNIMTFIAGSRLAANVGKVTEDCKANLGALKAAVPMQAVHVSCVDKKHANMAVTSLHDLFHNADQLSGNTFRTTFSVVRVNPGNVAEWTKVYDAKTKKASSAKGKSGNLIW